MAVVCPDVGTIMIKVVGYDDGGSTRSAYWCQPRADILDRPVVLPEHAEPALGAGVLAASPGRAIADVAAEMVIVREYQG